MSKLATNDFQVVRAKDWFAFVSPAAVMTARLPAGYWCSDTFLSPSKLSYSEGNHV